jgi:molybdenum cofactor guanylyltransferase
MKLVGSGRSGTLGVVLAGGGSSRFGSNKALARLAGETLLERALRRISLQVDRAVVSAGPDTRWLNDDTMTVISDRSPVQGPLSGVIASLSWARLHGFDYVATVPCDVPFFPADLVNRLSGALGGNAACAFASRCQQKHPVFAMWRAEIESRLGTEFQTGLRSLHAIDTVLECTFVDFRDQFDGPNGDPFFNINLVEDLAAAQNWLGPVPARD